MQLSKGKGGRGEKIEESMIRINENGRLSFEFILYAQPYMQRRMHR
jgi:hypothetical protein